MYEERSGHQKIVSSSDRSFGLTVGGILVVIVGYRWWGDSSLDTIGTVLLVIAVPLITLGAIYPPALAPLNKAWTKLGLVMFKVINPIIMFLIYVSTIVPIGFCLKAVGKDPLRLKTDPTAKTYWIERDPAGPTPKSMKNQF